MIKFGGPVFTSETDPESIAKLYKQKGYTAAYVPWFVLKNKELVKATRNAFERENIVLAEVGHWANLMDLDEEEMKKNRDGMLEALYLAEELGARCAVNVWGSYCYGGFETQHSVKNFSDDAFTEAVDMARYFIDTVKPKTAYFTYEIFPFNIVNSVENIAKLVKAVDREKFGVHFDLVNLIDTPYKYFDNAAIVKEMIKAVGERIVAAHIKDIKLKEPAISVILEEVPAGQGNIDFGAFLTAIEDLPRAIPVLMEHLPNEQTYDMAAAHIRGEAKKVGIEI